MLEIRSYDPCPVCGGMRKAEIRRSDKIQIVDLECECARRDEVKPEKQIKERSYRQVVNFMERCGLEGNFRESDGKNAKSLDLAKRYVDKFESIRTLEVNGMVLEGDPRQGKTFAAGAMVRSLYEKGYNVLYDTAMGFVENYGKTRRGVYTTISERIREADIVLVDDLGATRMSQFGQECLTNLIDACDKHGVPLLITTNIDLTKRAVASDATLFEQRVYGRILKRCLINHFASERTFRTSNKVKETYEALWDVSLDDQPHGATNSERPLSA